MHNQHIIDWLNWLANHPHIRNYGSLDWNTRAWSREVARQVRVDEEFVM